MHAVAEENSLDINNNMKKKNADDNCTSTYNHSYLYPETVSSRLWLRDNFRMAGLTFNKKMQGQLAARKFIL